MNEPMEKICVPERLNQVVEDAVTQLKIAQKQKRRKKVVVIGGTTAAVLTVAVLFFGTHPALASRLPFIGHLFEEVEEDITYPGKYSENAEILISGEEAEKIEKGEAEESVYSQISNGVTVTISEVYYNDYNLYLAIRIHWEEGVPEDFAYRNKNRNYEKVSIWAKCLFDGKLWAHLDEAQGHFIDDSTFVGIIQKDRHAQTVDTNEIVEIPDNYKLKINMVSIHDDNYAIAPKKSIGYRTMVAVDEKWEAYEFEGEWNFEMDVQKDASKTMTVDVNRMGQEGIGIRQIMKTPYEIGADIIVPEGKDPVDYMTVICDANGDLLPSHGSMAELYNIYEQDVSKVYVYVCDSREYFNELKGYFWSQDYEEKRKEKTFAEYLSEYALVSAEVAFETE